MKNVKARVLEFFGLIRCYFLLWVKMRGMRDRVRFRKIRNYGEVSERGLIYINFLKHRDFDELIDTFLHECIHILEPSWGEVKVHRVARILARFYPRCYFLFLIDKFLKSR